MSEQETRTPTRDQRATLTAIKRGAKCRCPNCGEGKLFRAYLKVKDQCASCGEALHHHRADDAPPYIAIVIVGHLIVGLMLHLEMRYTVQPWMYLVGFVPLTIILPLAMLPAIKGSVVAIQWANYMHGFDPKNRDDG